LAAARGVRTSAKPTRFSEQNLANARSSRSNALGAVRVSRSKEPSSLRRSGITRRRSRIASGAAAYWKTT